MLISPSWKLENRVERLKDGFWHVKSEYRGTWTTGDQGLLDKCNSTIREYREERTKFIFDEDID